MWTERDYVAMLFIAGTDSRIVCKLLSCKRKELTKTARSAIYEFEYTDIEIRIESGTEERSRRRRAAVKRDVQLTPREKGNYTLFLVLGSRRIADMAAFTGYGFIHRR